MLCCTALNHLKELLTLIHYCTPRILTDKPRPITKTRQEAEFKRPSHRLSGNSLASTVTASYSAAMVVLSTPKISRHFPGPVLDKVFSLNEFTRMTFGRKIKSVLKLCSNMTEHLIRGWGGIWVIPIIIFHSREVVLPFKYRQSGRFA